MTQTEKPKKVRVRWFDAVIYSEPVKNKMELEPAVKITEGILEKESEEGIIIKNPYTIGEKNKIRSKEEEFQKAKFLFITRGMISKIENL